MGKKLWLFLALCVCAVSMAFAQQTVTGTVVETETGEPVIGASVRVKGTDLGKATDTNGRFTLNNVPSNAKTLIVSYMGLETKEVAIKPSVRVSLNSASHMLKEQIVVAYGTSTKESYTGAVGVIDAQTIEDRQISNVSNALAGNVAGVTATKSNGQPGTGSTIRIRGFGSINAGMNPLYVLDGMPYDGDIAAINPNDIESMSVLKDAAGTALYGARGANGVIMITTKKGARNSDAKVTFDASWGKSSRQVKNYDVMTSTDQYYETLYKAHYNNAVYNLGYSPATAYSYASNQAMGATGYQVYDLSNVASGNLFTADGKIDPNATLGYSDGQYYYRPDDWQKESFRNGLRQEYNVGVQGGTDKISYYFSAGYLNDEGVIKKSAFERITTRANVEYQAKKWLKLTANIAYTNSTSSYPDAQTDDRSSGNAFYLANILAPVYPFYSRNADGTVMYNGKNPVYDYGDRTGGNFTRNVMSIANAIGDLTYQTEEYCMDIFNSRWGVEINPIEGLTLSARLGMNLDNTRYHLASSSLYGQSKSYGGSAEQDLTRTRELTQQYMATYRNHIGDDHNFDLLAVYETYDYNAEDIAAYGQNLYQQGVWAVNNSIDERRGYGSVNEYATRSWIGRANYDFQEKYFGSVSVRRDASSRFWREEGRKWGTFWSASAAWNIAKEDFMKNLEFVNMLKLRASFGQQGNDNIGNLYAWADQYTMTGSEGVFSDGTLAYKGNKQISWEKSNSFDVAVDFDLWNGKLSGSIDYYNRTTQDMLYNKPVALSNGYPSIPMNIGSMRNHGLEFDLHSQIINTKDIRWNVDFNITTNWNKVLKLHPDLKGELIDGTRIYREGESMYQMYLVKYAGVDPTTGLALYWAKDSHDNVYTTTDWSTAYNTNRQGTGNMLSKATGGLGTSVYAYGFDFAIQCSYQFGGKLYDSGYQGFMHNGSSSNAGQNWHKDILNAWTPENTHTSVPRLAATGSGADQYANSTSDRWLISSAYFGINNITIGYTLPKSITRRVSIDSVRFFGSADNVAIFSARKGMDPRFGVITAAGYTYSALRTITGGVKITF